MSNAPAPAAAPAAPAPALKEYTYDEVAQHNKEGDCWIIIDLQVIDVSKYTDDHPGGADQILKYAGREDEDEFEMVQHSKDAVKLMKSMVIGTVPKVGSAVFSMCVPACDLVAGVH